MYGRSVKEYYRGDLNKPSVRIGSEITERMVLDTVKGKDYRKARREIERGQMIDSAMERERQRVARKNTQQDTRKPIKTDIKYKDVRSGKSTATQEMKSRAKRSK
jgi:hypothetical protein